MYSAMYLRSTEINLKEFYTLECFDENERKIELVGTALRNSEHWKLIDICFTDKVRKFVSECMPFSVIPTIEIEIKQAEFLTVRNLMYLKNLNERSEIKPPFKNFLNRLKIEDPNDKIMENNIARFDKLIRE